ncbi:hypothetical protein [Stenoxybacter acetivorans]|uniref:hypothetical protein n=1 Tax=Stenoxybacter acetivorans TaxID=422441 RepID=UPI000566F5C5|nr:hypothetical protein [Stenoxybacter acetivorans]
MKKYWTLILLSFITVGCGESEEERRKRVTKEYTEYEICMNKNVNIREPEKMAAACNHLYPEEMREAMKKHQQQEKAESK